MKRMIFVMGLSLILLSSISMAISLADSLAYWTFDNNSVADYLGNFNGVNDGTTNTSGKIKDARNFDGTNDVINFNDPSANLTGGTWGISAWVFLDVNTNERTIFIVRNTAGDDIYAQLDDSSGNFRFIVRDDAANIVVTTAAGKATTGNWHHVVGVKNGNNVYLYVDNTSYSNSGSFTTFTETTDFTKFGYVPAGANHYDGKIDEVYFVNKAWSASDVADLYYYGLTGVQYPFNITPPVSSSNHSIEKTSLFSQSGNIISATTTYTDILTSNVNITNATDAYISFTQNVARYGVGGADNVTCRILVDSIDYDTETIRTNGGNMEYGSWYIVSSNFSIEGDTEIKLQCKGSGGPWQLINGQGLIHYLIDSNAKEIPHEFFSNDINITSSSWQLLDEHNYTTISENISAAEQLGILLDLKHEISYISAANISFVAELNGINTTISTRTGSAGSIGIAADFLKINISEGSNVTFRLYGKSTSSDGSLSYNAILKEFINHPTEAVYNGSYSQNITFSDYQTIQSTFMENNDSIDNLVYQAAIGSYSNSGAAEIDYQVVLQLSNGTEINGTEIWRDVSSSGNIGIGIIQYEFYGVSAENNTIILRAKSSNSNVTIESINAIAYYSEEFLLDNNSFSIYAYDSSTLASLSNISAWIGDLIYTSISGVIDVSTDQLYLNMIIGADENGGYYNESVSAHNTSQNYNASLDPYFAISFSPINNYNNGTYNFSRNLNNTITYRCPGGSNTSIAWFINGIYTSLYPSVSCDGTNGSIYLNYTHSSEGLFNISYGIVTDYRPSYNNISSANQTFLSDLYNPSATINYSVFEGFSGTNLNYSLLCIDNMTATLGYYIVYNTTLYNNNLTNATQYNNTTMALDGEYDLTGTCSDYFGNTSDTETLDLYVAQLCLIDEVDNTLFNVTNLSLVRVYKDDNSTYFDFKVDNSSCVNYTSELESKLRFELKYPGNTIITRYVDLALTDADVRVCADKDDVLFYEQLIISGSVKAVFMKSVFANCIIAADYTRFAYQTSYLLKAYTIATQYYIYNYEEDIRTFLASLDGSIESYIDIDSIEFGRGAFTLSITQDTLTFTPDPDNNQTLVYYSNSKGDNTALNFYIIRMDTDQVLLNTSDFSDYNDFNLVFSYNGLSNITNATLFKAVVSGMRGDTPFEKAVYFNINGQSGILKTGVAIALSLLLLIFGLTLLSAQNTFSWFGIIVTLGGVFILSVAVPMWYSYFLMVLEIIILIFMVLVLINKNTASVT